MSKFMCVECSECGTMIPEYYGLTQGFGLKHYSCPVCGNEEIVEGMNLTDGNILFPEHFEYVALEESDDEVIKNNDEITNLVRTGIKFLIENEEEAYWVSAGTVLVVVLRDEGEGMFRVYVSTDYFETIAY